MYVVCVVCVLPMENGISDHFDTDKERINDPISEPMNELCGVILFATRVFECFIRHKSRIRKCYEMNETVRTEQCNRQSPPSETAT